MNKETFLQAQKIHQEIENLEWNLTIATNLFYENVPHREGKLWFTGLVGEDGRDATIELPLDLLKQISKTMCGFYQSRIDALNTQFDSL